MYFQHTVHVLRTVLADWRRLVPLLLALALAGAVRAQDDARYAETFKYDERIHDFGTIREKDGKVSHTFTFTNRGTRPVVISDVNAWCGCTTAEYTRSVIQPGKRGRVTVTYNPNRRPGRFSKEVVVMLNGGAEYTRIWVKGNVVGTVHPVTEDHPYAFGAGLYMGYKVIPFASLKAGEEATVVQRIANDTGRELTVDFVRVPDNRVLRMPARITLKPHERTTFKVSYRAPKSYRYNRHILVYPVVGGKRLKPMRINWFGSDGRSFSR